ncbi:AsnC family protein, partial [Acinetobacter baumannii]
MSEISLDNFDYAILRILQKDNKTSHREISDMGIPKNLEE